MPAAFLDFTRTCEAAASTASKLAKQSLLASYLKQLDDADLPLAIHYFVGRPFASTDDRNLTLGGATISNLLLDLLHLDPDYYYRHVVSHGEIGEAVSRLWPPGGLGPGERGIIPNSYPPVPLHLQRLNWTFEKIAATGVVEHKRQLLEALLRRCTDPREAAYLLKIVLGEPRTGVQEGVLQAGIAQAFNHPLKQIQRTQLLLGDLAQVALLAKHNQLESARFTLFHPIQFMLAIPKETPHDIAEAISGRTYLCEDKLDGIRAHIHKSADHVVIYTRTLSRAEEAFPDIVRAIKEIPGDFLLDGEIVPYCDGCVLPFAHVQKRLGRKKLTPAILRENPLAFIAFDLLYLNGQNLMDQPLRQRRAALANLPSSLLRSSAHEVSTESAITAAFGQARARRNEGIVLKDPDSPYTPGRRGTAWLKLKSHLPTLDCVVTAAEYGHGKRRAVLSDYTFAVWDRDPSHPDATLVNIGKAYSGVTDEEIKQLTELFLKLSLQQLGHVHLVQPQVVLEIAFDQIQKSDRHSSGHALRFPRIKRIRWDKSPHDADRLERVLQLYNDPSNTARGDAVPVTSPEPTLFDDL